MTIARTGSASAATRTAVSAGLERMPSGFIRDDLQARHDEAARRTGRGLFELRAHCLRRHDAEDEARRALPALASA